MSVARILYSPWNKRRGSSVILRACCDSRSGSRQWWYRWEASNGSFSKKSVFRAAVRYATLIVKISNVAAVYHRLAGQRVRFDHPPPPPSGMDGGSPLSPALFLSLSRSRVFFIPCTNPPRSIFVTTCEQTVARTHSRTHAHACAFPTVRTGFACVCPWQIQVPDNADGTKDSYFPMHVGRNAAAGDGGKGRGGDEGRGEEGKGKKERRAKVVADCETLEYGDGIADIEERRPMEPVQKGKKRGGWEREREEDG